MLTGEDEDEDEDEEESEEEEEQAPPPKVGPVCAGSLRTSSSKQVQLPVDSTDSQHMLHTLRRPHPVHAACHKHHSVRSAHSHGVRCFTVQARSTCGCFVHFGVWQFSKPATVRPGLQVGAKRGAQTPQPSKPTKQAKQEPQTAPPKQAGKGAKQAPAPAAEAKGVKGKGAAKETPTKGERPSTPSSQRRS